MKSYLIGNTSNDIPMEKGGRSLVWHDEFDGLILDDNKWHITHSMDNGQTYDNSEKHLRVENNNLHMQIHRCNDEEYSLCEGLSTRKTMNFKYGFLEMRAKVAYRHCAWPSFWMMGNSFFHNESLGWFAEIDIFEIFSSQDTAIPNLHKWGKAGHEMLPGGEEDNQYRGYKFKNTETLNDEYHIYGFEWDEHDMKFYIDNVCYYTVPIDERCSFVSERYPTAEGFHEPAYIQLNNEIFTTKSKWLPKGYAATPEDPMPIDYYVDWIRLYQHKDKEKIYFKAEISEVENK